MNVKRVRYIGDYYKVALKKGEIYKAESELRGMYAIRDSEGELYAYPVSQFEVVEDNNMSLDEARNAYAKGKPIK